MTGWEAVLQMLIPMCTVICLAGAILFFLHAKGNRSRRLLAYVMFAWGLVYVFCVLGILLGFMSFMKTDILAPFILISGNLYAIITLLYPLEIIRPGWLNLKRGLFIIFPCLFIVSLYYFMLYLLGETPVRLKDWNDFIAHISRFNVWYRLVIALSVAGYMVYQMRLIYRYELAYQQWRDANYVSTEGMAISSLRYYGLGMVFILFAFFWILLDGNTYCYVVHNTVVLLFFCLVFYKGLYCENPCLEDFFRNRRDENMVREEVEAEPEPEPEPELSDAGKKAKKEKSIDEMIFMMKLPEYKIQVQQWMEETRPYLHPDFKLMDVVAVLPLNRTYLSMVFNNGWGASFCNVVRDYRIRHAEELLVHHPELSISRISELSGFSSPSTFYRTFVLLHDNVTPKKYRERFENEQNQA